MGQGRRERQGQGPGHGQRAVRRGIGRLGEANPTRNKLRFGPCGTAAETGYDRRTGPGGMGWWRGRGAGRGDSETKRGSPALPAGRLAGVPESVPHPSHRSNLQVGGRGRVRVRVPGLSAVADGGSSSGGLGENPGIQPGPAWAVRPRRRRPGAGAAPDRLDCSLASAARPWTRIG